MTATQTLIEAAADHLSELVVRIARRAYALIAADDTLTPRQNRASNHILRIIELCALLVFRAATNPGYQPPTKIPKQNKDQAGAAALARSPPPRQPPQRRPERTDRADALPRGSNRSTMALVAEINLQFRLATKAVGEPFTAELEHLCRQAIEAATHLQNITAPTPQTSPAQPPTANQPLSIHPQPPTPPKPAPTTTLEL